MFFLRLLCLENLYEQAATKEDKKLIRIDGKESYFLDKFESFHTNKWF